MKFTHTISNKVDIELHDMQQALKAAEDTPECKGGAAALDVVCKKVQEYAVLSAVDFAGAFEERHSSSWGDVTVKVHAMEISGAKITSATGRSIRIVDGAMYERIEGGPCTSCDACVAAYGCPLCVALCSGYPFECPSNIYWAEAMIEAHSYVYDGAVCRECSQYGSCTSALALSRGTTTMLCPKLVPGAVDEDMCYPRKEVDNA